MKDTTQRFMLGILFGAGVTLLASAGVLTFVVTPKAAVATLPQVQDQDLKKILDTYEPQIETHPLGATHKPTQLSEQEWIRRRLISAFQVSITSTSSMTRVLEKSQQLNRDLLSGYTSLVEPAPAGSSPLQLFDVFRPGLGTMLAKMQAAQSPQIAVRWVIPGHVKPMTNSRGYSYCWLNANGEVDAANCPAANQ
jgi:hypothetical protein